MSDKMRCVIYARLSRTDENENIEGQIELCREYALKRGYEVVATLEEDFTSGYDLSTEKLDIAIEMAESGQYDIFLCRDSGRFSREPIKADLTLMQLQQSGVGVEYVWETYADDEAGEFSHDVRKAFNKFEGAMIRKRMKEGTKRKIKKGSFIAKNPPFAYRQVNVGTDKNKFYIAEVENDLAKTVELIFSLCLSGSTLRGIAQKLSDDNIPTPSQSGYGKQKSDKWNRQTIKKILRSPAYIGKWQYGKETKKKEWKFNRDNGKWEKVTKTVRNPESKWITVEIPQIISESDWNKVQTILDGNKDKKGPAEPKYKFLLRHRFRCACGATLQGRAIERKTKTYFFYRCYKNASDGTCRLPQFRREEIDDVAWEWLYGLLTNRKLLHDKLANLKNEFDTAVQPLYAKRDALSKLAKDKSDEYESLSARYSKATDYEKSKLLDPRMTMLAQEIQTAENESDKLHDQIVQLEMDYDAAIDWHEHWQEYDTPEGNLAYFMEWEKEDEIEKLGDFGERRKLVEKFNLRATLVEKEDGIYLHLTCDLDEIMKLLSTTVIYRFRPTSASKSPHPTPSPTVCAPSNPAN